MPWQRMIFPVSTEAAIPMNSLQSIRSSVAPLSVTPVSGTRRDHRSVSARALILFASFAVAGLLPASAQDANPFDDPAGGKPAGNAPAADAPAAGAAPAKQPSPDATADRPKRDHPVLEAIKELEPKTPAEWLMAARACRQIEAYPEARRFTQRVLDAGLDSDALLALHERFGSALFLAFRLDEQMQPEGSALSTKVMEAVRSYWSDESRVTERLEAAAKAEHAMRRSLVQELRGGGTLPVALLVRWLADPARRGAAADIIRAWQPSADEPLGRALTAFWSLKTDGIELLPQLRRAQITPLVVATAVSPKVSEDERERALRVAKAVMRRVPSKREAEAYLRTMLRQHLDDAASVRRNDPMQRDTTWAWDPKRGTVVFREVWRDEWLLVRAGRAGVALLQLDPDDAETGRLVRLMDYQLQFGDGGEGSTISITTDVAGDSADDVAPEELEPLLEQALSEDLLIAAERVCELMRDRGASSLVASTDGAPTLLVRTLDHAERRVRFAALQAVVALAPERAFAGSSRVIESISALLRSHGHTAILIGHPRMRQSNELAGVARQMGYRAYTASSGREVVATLARELDVSLVVVSDLIDHPTVLETVQAIRKSIAGQSIPILVASSGERLESLRRTFSNDPRVFVEIVPADEAVMSQHVKRLLSRVGRGRLSPQERAQQLIEALRLANRIMASPAMRSYLDVTRLEQSVVTTLPHSRSAVDAARFLAQLGTAGSQSALFDAVLRPALPERTRKASLVALADCFRHHGILLTSKQLARLDRPSDLGEKEDAIRQVMAQLVREARSAR